MFKEEPGSRVKVFELPMRDGNIGRFLCPTAISRVFELPMRDGNMRYMQIR